MDCQTSLRFTLVYLSLLSSLFNIYIDTQALVNVIMETACLYHQIKICDTVFFKP